jgi:hypothetical protein
MSRNTSSKQSGPTTKFGRLIVYDRETVISICRRVFLGEDLDAICAKPPMPIAGVFLAWIQDHPEARAIYRSVQNFEAIAGWRKNWVSLWMITSVNGSTEFVPIASAAGHRTIWSENTSHPIGAKCTPWWAGRRCGAPKTSRPTTSCSMASRRCWSQAT